jgi:two-component sensor histidine kinase
MTDDSSLKKILFSTWFMAAIPALLVIVFLPPISSKFNLSVEPQKNSYLQQTYSDLNSDSISESIYSLKGNPYFYVVAKNIDSHIYDQWNLPDSLDPMISRLFFGNYDHNRFKEVYIFSHNRDSLFLNINELADPKGLKKNRLFVAKIGFINNMVTGVVMPAGFFDEDGDGLDELYFSVSPGFRTGLRRLYSFDIKSGKLKTSQETGIICLNPTMTDADGDLRPEVFGEMSASGNYPSSLSYSDSSTWFMVFNDQLEFKFPPVEFPGFANYLLINKYKTDTFSGYALLHLNRGTDTTVLKSQVMLWSLQGTSLRSRPLTDFSSSESVQLFILHHNKSDRLCIIGDKMFETNEKLEITKSADIPFHSRVFSYKADINNDGDDELLIYSAENEKLVVYNGDLEKYGDKRVKIPLSDWKFSDYYGKDHEHKLYLEAGGGYFLKLDKNKYYWFSFLAYPGIYFMIFLFIWLVRRVNTWQVEYRESLERRLVTLQLQGLRAQLDPHFTFNTLNSIASLIYLEDRHRAYDYLNKFTQLLRSLLNDAERIYRSVAEEVEFTTTYLDLEKLRFGEKFSYNIEIADEVSCKELVPKLVMHTFAENAIKHGLLPRDDGGVLKISIEREDDCLRLLIEDNGIGRKNAQNNSKSTGKGLNLTKELYEILNRINKKPIKYFITDLHDAAGEPSGTRVEVLVPLDLVKDKSLAASTTYRINGKNN